MGALFDEGPVVAAAVPKTGAKVEGEILAVVLDSKATPFSQGSTVLNSRRAKEFVVASTLTRSITYALPFFANVPGTFFQTQHIKWRQLQ
tara:strand:+ start:414 stop:683 length:270 start_codon:yes stop_codon:yes gene_type:complete